jgi:hypothetical protein
MALPTDTGCSINMGLLFLRRTIQALEAGVHVPYRSASLTKLLYPSLSRGSVTWMLATVSPEPIDAYESQQCSGRKRLGAS